MHRSHITQELVNYFDASDVRTRETPWTIEGQLLNASACAIEDLDVRIGREVRARFLGQVPLNLDHAGVWYAAPLPPGSEAPERVEGIRGGITTVLRAYDDTLPVPSSVEYDSRREAVLASSLELFRITGDDQPQTLPGFPMAIPNRIWLWLEGMGDSSNAVTVTLVGHPHPRTYWASSSEPVREQVLLDEEGSGVTVKAFAEITSVEVRNLPSGASLSAYLLPCALPWQQDSLRPYTHPAYRDRLLPRRWGLEGRLVKEMFSTGRFAGNEVSQSYLVNGDPLSLTIEPNTFGLLVAVEGKLLYADRREPIPEGLYRTSLSEEPLYGLTVNYDQSRPGDTRSILLQAVPYAKADQMTQYRIWTIMPDGSHWLITPGGDWTRYSAQGGWFRGVPPEITLTLPTAQTGTWLFVLECLDRTGHKTEDRQPYLHAAFQPQVELDVSNLVPQLAGVGFDYRDRLWLWTGSFLVPAHLRYDAYLYEAEQRTLYLTDTYDEVRLS